MDTKTDMLRKLKGRRDGYSLDRAFYTDPDYYRQDLENIWYKDWLFIGHDCEIPRAGNYFTVQVGDYPVVVTRDRQGTIRALHNSCRHRGSRVCTQAKGLFGKARLSLSPVDLRTRRLAALRTPDGRGFRQGGPQPEADPLRNGRRLHLHQPVGDAGRFCGLP